MNAIKTNFEQLVSNLEKGCLDNHHCHKGSKIRKSKIYNAYIAERNPCFLYASIVGSEYFDKCKAVEKGEMSQDDFIIFLNKFKKTKRHLLEKSNSKFKLFVYLEGDKFCIDIQENKVRTKLLEIDVPEEVVGGHNGSITHAFEICINNQIRKYISQKQTNIEIIKELPNFLLSSSI